MPRWTRRVFDIGTTAQRANDQSALEFIRGEIARCLFSKPRRTTITAATALFHFRRAQLDDLARDNAIGAALSADYIVQDALSICTRKCFRSLARPHGSMRPTFVRYEPISFSRQSLRRDGFVYQSTPIVNASTSGGGERDRILCLAGIGARACGSRSQSRQRSSLQQPSLAIPAAWSYRTGSPYGGATAMSNSSEQPGVHLIVAQPCAIFWFFFGITPTPTVTHK